MAIRRYSTIFGRWLSGFHWLLNAPDILSNCYVSICIIYYVVTWALMSVDHTQAPGVPFAVPTPENHSVVVSLPAHIKELSDAREIKLSLHAWGKRCWSKSSLPKCLRQRF